MTFDESGVKKCMVSNPSLLDFLKDAGVIVDDYIPYGAPTCLVTTTTPVVSTNSAMCGTH